MYHIPPHATFVEKYDPVALIKTHEEARKYFEACVAHTVSWGQTPQEAEVIERLNIGYWAGYFDEVTYHRILRLFRVTHPLFGLTYPTPEEALAMGLEQGRKEKLKLLLKKSRPSLPVEECI